MRTLDERFALAAKTPLVVVVPCDENEPVRVYAVTKEPSLKRLQRMVGGYIERVPHWQEIDGQPCNVWVNEEGKLNQLKLNKRATLTWWHVLRQHVDDYLVGNVVIVIGFPDEEYNG